MNPWFGDVARLRRRASSEDGFSLAEVLVTMMIMGIALPIFYGVLSSVQQSAARNDYLSRANDQARLAVEELDREIRSGNVLYDPANESPSHFTMRIYTQANATTRAESFGTPGYVCALWTIDDDGRLIKNMWPPNRLGESTGWRVVAEGIVNRDQDPLSNGYAFVLDSDLSKGRRTVNIKLLVNPNPDSSWSRTVLVETASTGRNTSYGFPEDVCNGTPS
ncbi:MAG TPA: type II secretion system protein [Actinomycetota bacterium]